MLRASIWVVLAALASSAPGCGEDEESGGGRSDAGSDVSASDAPEDSPLDTGSDAPPSDAGADGFDSADAASDEAEAFDSAEAATDAGSDAAEAEAGSGLGAMSVAELAAALPSKTFIMLNVHVPYAGEIPGTDANLDYKDVPSIEAYIGTNKGVDVVLYCYSNSMALSAGNALLADGYTKVRYVDGGLAAWKNAGHPVEFHDK